MTREEAVKLLRFHTEPEPSSFIGSLRPFSGLKENAFREVMEALHVLASEFQERTIDQEIVSSLWFMCHEARAWRLDPDGMLQRNNLMSDEETRKLEQWVRSISWAVLVLLDSGNVEEAFREPGPGQ